MTVLNLPLTTEAELMAQIDYWQRRADIWTNADSSDMAERIESQIVGMLIHYVERLHVVTIEAEEVEPRQWKVTRWFDDRHTDSQVISGDFQGNHLCTAKHYAIQAAQVSAYRFRREAA